MGGGNVIDLERDRRLNQRHIPTEFTDLLSACFQCLPGDRPPAILADLLSALSAAVCRADLAGGADWPEAARDLLARARAELNGPRPVIPGALIRAATECDWPHPAARLWNERADLA